MTKHHRYPCALNGCPKPNIVNLKYLLLGHFQPLYLMTLMSCYEDTSFRHTSQSKISLKFKKINRVIAWRYPVRLQTSPSGDWGTIESPKYFINLHFDFFIDNLRQICHYGDNRNVINAIQRVSVNFPHRITELEKWRRL